LDIPQLFLKKKRFARKFGNPGLAVSAVFQDGQVKLDSDPTSMEANVGSGAGTLP